MIRLRNAAQSLQELQNTQGKNAKSQYIADNAGDADFLTLLKARLDPFKAYKIRKIDEYQMLEPTLTFSEYVALLYTLSTSNINGDLRDKVRQTLSHAEHDIVETLEGIITKTLALGVDTSVNKALNYELIPSFKVGLASPLKDNSLIPERPIVEKKEDGVRCIIRIKDGVCKLYTRKGRELDFPLIATEALAFSQGEDLTLDSELTTTQRTDISGICNRNMKSGYTVGSDAGISGVMFDIMPTEIFDTQGKTKTQRERTLELQARMLNFSNKHLVLTESVEVSSLAEVVKINKKYIDDGFEGVIVKDPEAPYAFKRSRYWLKLKAINSCTLEVVGVDTGKGKRAGKVGSLRCKSSDGGILVSVGSGLSDEDVEMFTKVPPIGKLIEVTFNVLIKGFIANTYSLFLPRYDQMRIDLTEADSTQKVIDQHIGKIEE